MGIASLPKYMSTKFQHLAVSGNIHNGVHVLRFSEAVPQANQAEREATATAGLEEMVHTDLVSAQVRLIFYQSLVCTQLRLFTNAKLWLGLLWRDFLFTTIQMRSFPVQLPTRLRASDSPREPHVRHHLHPTQRPREDRLRSSRRHPPPRQDLPREHEEHALYCTGIRM